MMEFLNKLWQLAPVVAVLGVAIWYFWRKETDYVIQITQLNKELRENERETLDIINKLTITLDKLIESDGNMKSELIKEINNLKELILSKIESIKR